MAFQTSPGIYTNEYDFTQTAVGASGGAGAIAGVFNDGPINLPILVTSEKELVSIFGAPSDNNPETFFAAADFLSYSNRLWVTRVADSTIVNAVTSGTAARIINATEALAANTIGAIIARTPGIKGNSLKVVVCPSGNAYSNAITGISISVGANTGTVTDFAKLSVGDILQVNDGTADYDLVVTAAANSSVQFKTSYRGKSSLSTASGTRFWRYYKSTKAPTTGNIHIAIVDEDGAYTGITDNLLEIYKNVSVTAGAKRSDSTNNYYKDQINFGLGTADGKPSQYVFATGTNLTASGVVAYSSLAGGGDGANADSTENTVSLSELQSGYDFYADKSTYDIRYILAGKARGATATIAGRAQIANYLIDNIAEYRKDCMVFVSPSANSITSPAISGSTAVTDTIAFRNALSSSSYAVLDSGYKYRYDNYNKVYRWVPMNGDMAGLVARTAIDRDPWYSPAGYNRGKLKNVIKLAFNPNEAQRDALYPNDINPIVTQSGDGTLLFGDKTLAGLNTAFDHINVRMLFITIEKAIQEAAKASLFEFNDAFTRAQFKNIVEPYLRDVQGRRGIYDFKVVCDETNNTPQVIDSNTFIGDIFIKPARSINYIQLNFIAVPTGTAFEEIVLG